MKNLTDSQELERRVAALEAAVEENASSLRRLAEDWRKQRALNEELFAWFESDCDSEVSESLVAAFVEVLK